MLEDKTAGDLPAEKMNATPGTDSKSAEEVDMADPELNPSCELNDDSEIRNPVSDQTDTSLDCWIVCDENPENSIERGLSIAKTSNVVREDDDDIACTTDMSKMRSSDIVGTDPSSTNIVVDDDKQESTSRKRPRDDDHGDDDEVAVPEKRLDVKERMTETGINVGSDIVFPEASIDNAAARTFSESFVVENHEKFLDLKREDVAEDIGDLSAEIGETRRPAPENVPCGMSDGGVFDKSGIACRETSLIVNETSYDVVAKSDYNELPLTLTTLECKEYTNISMERFDLKSDTPMNDVNETMITDIDDNSKSGFDVTLKQNDDDISCDTDIVFKEICPVKAEGDLTRDRFLVEFENTMKKEELIDDVDFEGKKLVLNKIVINDGKGCDDVLTTDLFKSDNIQSEVRIDLSNALLTDLKDIMSGVREGEVRELNSDSFAEKMVDNAETDRKEDDVSENDTTKNVLVIDKKSSEHSVETGKMESVEETDKKKECIVESGEIEAVVEANKKERIVEGSVKEQLAEINNKERVTETVERGDLEKDEVENVVETVKNDKSVKQTNENVDVIAETDNKVAGMVEIDAKSDINITDTYMEVEDVVVETGAKEGEHSAVDRDTIKTLSLAERKEEDVCRDGIKLYDPFDGENEGGHRECGDDLTAEAIPGERNEISTIGGDAGESRSYGEYAADESEQGGRDLDAGGYSSLLPSSSDSTQWSGVDGYPQYPDFENGMTSQNVNENEMQSWNQYPPSYGLPQVFHRNEGMMPSLFGMPPPYGMPNQYGMPPGLPPMHGYWPPTQGQWPGAQWPGSQGWPSGQWPDSGYPGHSAYAYQSGQSASDWSNWWQNYSGWYNECASGWTGASVTPQPEQRQPPPPADAGLIRSQGSWSSTNQKYSQLLESFQALQEKEEATSSTKSSKKKSKSSSNINYKPTFMKGPVLTSSYSSLDSAAPKVKFSVASIALPPSDPPPPPSSSSSAQMSRVSSDTVEANSSKNLVSVEENKDEDPEEKDIWIGNLPLGTCAIDVRSLICQFGKVVKCKVGSMKSQRTAGLFALVTMETANDAAACIENLNQYLFKGQKLLVKKLQQK